MVTICKIDARLWLNMQCHYFFLQINIFKKIETHVAYLNILKIHIYFEVWNSGGHKGQSAFSKGRPFKFQGVKDRWMHAWQNTCFYKWPDGQQKLLVNLRFGKKFLLTLGLCRFINSRSDRDTQTRDTIIHVSIHTLKEDSWRSDSRANTVSYKLF